MSDPRRICPMCHNEHPEPIPAVKICPGCNRDAFNCCIPVEGGPCVNCEAPNND